MTTVAWLVVLGIGYLVLTSPKRAGVPPTRRQPGRAPITARTFPGGWNVTVPGFLALGTGPGGTSVVLDPNSPLWKGLTTGIYPQVPETVPPDSPIVTPPELVPSMAMTAPTPDFGLPPDAAPSPVAVDPCLFDPAQCLPTDPSVFTIF